MAAPRTFSKDVEDILAVFDGRPELVNEVNEARADVRAYIEQSLQALLSDPNFRYAVEGYLSDQPDRAPLVLQRIRSLLIP